MRNLDDFNKLEERAWELDRQLSEGTLKPEQALSGIAINVNAINGIDERSEKKAYELTEEYYANQKKLEE